jgi:hypothetical protein
VNINMKTRLITVFWLLSMVLSVGCAAGKSAAIQHSPTVVPDLQSTQSWSEVTTEPANGTNNYFVGTPETMSTIAIKTAAITDNSTSLTEQNTIVEPLVYTPSATKTVPASVRVDASVPKISIEDVHRKLNGTVDFILVDVRSKADFDKGHLAGALSVPIDMLAERYVEISPQAEIIVYSACT